MPPKRAAEFSEAPIRKTVRADDPGTIPVQTQVYIRPGGKTKLLGKPGVILGCGMSVHGATEYEVEVDGNLKTFKHAALLQRMAVELTECAL